MAQEKLRKRGVWYRKATRNMENIPSVPPSISIKKCWIKDYVSADLLKNLGNSYYFNAEYKEASETYKKLSMTIPVISGPEYYFRYSQTLKSLWVIMMPPKGMMENSVK